MVANTRRGCLQEVPNIVNWLRNFWYFGKLVAEERWTFSKGGRKQG